MWTHAAWTACGSGDEDRGMGTWVYLVGGAVIGLALGIGVSIVTDVPFAPEVGLALGLLAGWNVSRGRPPEMH